MSLRELGRLAELERIWIRNFKSLKDFELSAPTKLLIVAGMNGSGKTALVEFLSYSRKYLNRLVD
jgi:AAA15 family ATPase/GTPase